MKHNTLMHNFFQNLNEENAPQVSKAAESRQIAVRMV